MRPTGEENRSIFLPQTPEAFTYDADGNLKSDGRWVYDWDGENRLVVMTTKAGLPASVPLRRLEFVYDYMNRRCLKKVQRGVAAPPPPPGSEQNEGSGGLGTPGAGPEPGPEPAPANWLAASTTKFVWDGWNVTGELDGNDAVVRTYAWGLDLSGSEQGAGGVGGLAFVKVGTALGAPVYHLVMDGNGNAMSYRDSAGVKAAYYTYGPFGETITADGVAGGTMPYKFSTKYADAETGFLYYGYRYYNAGTGRWISRDPIEERGGLNLMLFVDNDSTNQSDLIGMRRVSVEFNAFINGAKRGKWIPEPGPGPLFPIFPPNGKTIFEFATDWRDFGESNHNIINPNSRLMSRAIIDSTRIGTGGALLIGGSQAGMSHRRYAKIPDLLAPPVGDEWTTISARSSVSNGAPHEYQIVDKCTTVIGFNPSASYPFITVAPNVRYDVTFVLKVLHPGYVSIGVAGSHGAFPDFEAYADDIVGYTRFSSGSGPDMLNLRGKTYIGGDPVYWIASVEADTPCNCPEK